MRNSVQLWFTRLEDPRFTQYIEIIRDGEENDEDAKEYYFWNGPYDPVYGIGVVL